MKSFYMQNRTNNGNVSVILMMNIIFLGIVLFSSTVRAANTDVSKEVKEAAAAIGEFTVEQKDAAVDKANELIGNMDNRIQKLETEMGENWANMKQSSRDQYNETLSTLRKKRNNLSEWYGSMKHSSKDAWDEVTQGFSKSYESLVQSWEDATQEMEDNK